MRGPPMTPPPPAWPRLSSALFYDDPAAAIGFLERAFGFETRIRVEGPDGAIVHSELEYGGAVVMVAGAGRHPWTTSPSRAGGNTQALFLYVDDVDGHCARARAAGATVLLEPHDSDHGPGYWADRSYLCTDPEGHRWWFATRLRTYAGG